MKEEILHTSLAQFLKYGVRQMSIQKLVAPLGISTKTVYKHFNSKEELLEEALRLHYRQQYDALEDLAVRQHPVRLLFDIWCIAIEREHKVNAVFFRDLHHYYPELERKIEITVAKSFSSQFIRIIQRGVKEGFLREGIHAQVTLEGIYVLYAAIARKEQFKRFGLAPYEVLLNTIATYIRGFCTAKGVRELDDYIRTYKTSAGTNKTRKEVAGASY